MLATRTESYFHAGVQQRGREYFRSGLVTNLKFSRTGTVTALVIGSRAYSVSIEFHRESSTWEVFASCNCPYVDEQTELCKHIWATMLAADADGRFGTPPEDPDVYLVSSDSDDDLDDLDEWFGRPALFGPAERDSHAIRRSGRGRAKQPEWERLLSSLAEQSRYAAPPSRFAPSHLEPHYILETDASDQRGGLVLSLAHQTLRADGTLGKLKKLSLKAADIPRLESTLDRRICLMLVGARSNEYAPNYRYGYGRRRASYSQYYGAENTGQSQWEVTEEVQSTLIPLLVESERLLVRAGSSGPATVLTVDDGLPWELRLAVEADEHRRRFLLTGHLERDGERKRLGEVQCMIKGDPAWFVYDNRLAQARMHDCGAWPGVLRKSGAVPVKQSDRGPLMQALSTLKACPPITWPEAWDVTDVRNVVPRPELSLAVEENAGGRSRFVSASVVFRYGDRVVDAARPGSVLLDWEAACQLHRDCAAERTFVARLLELGGEQTPGGVGLRIPTARIPELVSALLTEEWTVLGDQKQYRRAGAFSMNVRSGIDWFDLEGELDFDGETASLVELLAALRKGKRFVELRDGSMGMLPKDWLAKHASLLELGKAEDGRIRFAQTQVGLIDALLATMPAVDVDENFRAARDKLARFQGIRPRRPAKAFTGTLRPYQKEGLAWFHFLRDFGWGGCLADDMGLGKTVEVLALLAGPRPAGSPRASLLVMPNSVVFNWEREAARFAPKLRVLKYTGTARKALRNRIAKSDLVLTTYGTFKKDIEFLREHEFYYVVLDEAQAIKNPSSLNAKAARLLRARHRTVLTGTPVENRLDDLWSLFEFLNPGMLGSARAFGRAFTGSADENGNGDGGNVAMLQRMLRPFILRRTKGQVAKDLPERSEQVIECTMAPKQAGFYKKLRDAYRFSLLKRVDDAGLARSKVHVLEALLRLRQAACHPGMVDKTKTDWEATKLEVLLPRLTELIAEGHKALIFSQFTTLLAILRTKLDAMGLTYEYLDGKTRHRDVCVDRFQTDTKCPLFLISLKAGGLGLNLTAADYVFLLDPWWNPAVEAQAIDRTHRIGQDKKVIAYRLITRDTVEAKILELQQSKRNLAESIITQANSVIRDLTREDLEALLS